MPDGTATIELVQPPVPDVPEAFSPPDVGEHLPPLNHTPLNLSSHDDPPMSPQEKQQFDALVQSLSKNSPLLATDKPKPLVQPEIHTRKVSRSTEMMRRFPSLRYLGPVGAIVGLFMSFFFKAAREGSGGGGGGH